MIPGGPAVAAVFGYAAFLVVAFGVGPARRRRRVGRAGWHPPSSAVDLVGEALCAAGCIGTAVAPILALLDGAPVARAGGVRAGAGLGMLALGVMLALVAQHQMGDRWTPAADPTDEGLVTHGMFDSVRNPFYLGCMVSSVGVAVVVPNAVAIGAALAVVAAAELVVRFVEEPMLRAAHGPAYRAYQRRTGRFLPGIGRAG